MLQLARCAGSPCRGGWTLQVEMEGCGNVTRINETCPDFHIIKTSNCWKDGSCKTLGWGWAGLIKTGDWLQMIRLKSINCRIAVWHMEG